MNNKKLLLMVPPQEYGYGYINDFFWQQGILHLSAYIRHKLPGTSIKICDGNINDIESCRQAIKLSNCDVLGIPCVDHTKRHAIELANLALKQGCRNIVFGGSGPIFAPEQYLTSFNSRESESAISCCSGNGECTLEALLNEIPQEEVPNLTFLKNGFVVNSKIRTKKPTEVSYLDKLPFDSYPDIEKYVNNQLNRKDFPYKAITYSAISHDGCIHRVRNDNSIIRGCDFCAIPSERHKPRDPKSFWKEVKSFNDFSLTRLGRSVLSIKDWGDSLTGGVLQSLVDNRPAELSHIEYSGYLCASEVTKTNLDLLKKLNCFSVYMGIDGSDDASLKSLRKNYSLLTVHNALALLNTYNYNLEAGIVIGSEGTTEKTLDNTVCLLKKIKDNFSDRVIVLQGNIFVPMPGSYAFGRLKDKCIREYNLNPESLDIEGRIRLWLECFTKVSFEDCMNTQKAIETFSPRRHSYACQRKT